MAENTNKSEQEKRRLNDRIIFSEIVYQNELNQLAKYRLEDLMKRIEASKRSELKTSQQVSFEGYQPTISRPVTTVAANKNELILSDEQVKKFADALFNGANKDKEEMIDLVDETFAEAGIGQEEADKAKGVITETFSEKSVWHCYQNAAKYQHDSKKAAKAEDRYKKYQEIAYQNLAQKIYQEFTIDFSSAKDEITRTNVVTAFYQRQRLLEVAEKNNVSIKAIELTLGIFDKVFALGFHYRAAFAIARESLVEQIYLQNYPEVMEKIKRSSHKEEKGYTLGEIPASFGVNPGRERMRNESPSTAPRPEPGVASRRKDEEDEHTFSL